MVNACLYSPRSSAYVLFIKGQKSSKYDFTMVALGSDEHSEWSSSECSEWSPSEHSSRDGGFGLLLTKGPKGLV
jgi:hypothetical protein